MSSTSRLFESPQRVKIAAAVGQRLPLYCTATGKAFLAYLHEIRLARSFSESLSKYTEHTLVSRADLYQDLRETRLRGLRFLRQEYERDINAVAGPIMNAQGCPIAVIAIVGPSFRMPYERMLMLGQAIQETAVAIAREVGLAALPAILPKTQTPCITGYPEQKG